MPEVTITQLIQCPPTIIPGAKITLIGEAPGGQEIIWKTCPQCNYEGSTNICLKCRCVMKPTPKPFVGSSGNMLRGILRAAGINLDHCNRTNVVKERPPKDDFGIYYTDAKRQNPKPSLQWWRQLLIAELTKYRPNVVVALGNEALKALTNVSGITKYAGSLLQSSVIPGLKVLPMVHPAYIMRDNWEDYYVSIRFAKRLAIEQNSPSLILKEAEDEFILEPTLPTVLEWCEHIQHSNSPWYLDIETRGDTITCFGLSSALRPNKAICVPIQTTTGPYFSAAEEAAVWRALSLSARDNPLLGNQNLAYDIDYLLDYGVEPAGFYCDSMIAQNVNSCEYPKGLDFTTAIYTYYPYYKDEGKTWKKATPDRQVWIYNCKDMVTTPKVTEAIIKDLREKKQYEVYRTLSHKFLGVALEMQRNRLRLDPVWHKRLAGYLADERILKHRELTTLINQEINVKSTIEVKKLLYEELRLPKKKSRSTGEVTTGENELKELRAEHPEIPHIKLLLEERHLRTKESNYINVSFDTDPDGEVYLPYTTTIGGTKTSRWAYHKSPKWRGSSPQTIPKVMRLMYVPPPGSVFFQRDLSQAEARHVAWKSDCRFLLDTFASPIKIHKVVGGKIFNCDPSEIISDSPKYDISKRVVHGYDYKMQWKKVCLLANVDYAFGRRAYELYAAQVPEIPRWHNWVANTVKTLGRLTTPLGRVRECFKACSAITNTGQLPDEILRDLISWEPQSIVPDLTNTAMLQLWSEFPDVRWHQQGHDSFLASGKPSLTEAFADAAEHAANIHYTTRDINGRDKDCCIPGEFSWGYSWGAMLAYRPGEETSKEAWEARATTEGYFDEAKIKEKLLSLL